jgi:L-ascorbate metabolism protein UlaG (beta-lactamase superfamily)
MINVKWTGAAGIEFRSLQKTLLIDPYHTRCGWVDMLFRPLTPDKARIKTALRESGIVSGIVISHTHFDHAMDLPEIMPFLKGPLIGSPSLKTLMEKSGNGHRIMVCHGKESIDLDPFQVHMVLSVHGRVILGRVPYPGEIDPAATLPMKAGDYKVGTVFSPLIRINGVSFLHVGSAGFTERELAGHRCDVVFLCVPGWKRIPGYPEKILEITQPESVVLFHYDRFFSPFTPKKPTPALPFSDLQGLVEKIRFFSPKIEIRIPQLFETMMF